MCLWISTPSVPLLLSFCCCCLETDSDCVYSFICSFIHMHYVAVIQFLFPSPPGYHPPTRHIVHTSTRHPQFNSIGASAVDMVGYHHSLDLQQKRSGEEEWNCEGGMVKSGNIAEQCDMFHLQIQRGLKCGGRAAVANRTCGCDINCEI